MILSCVVAVRITVVKNLCARAIRQLGILHLVLAPADTGELMLPAFTVCVFSVNWFSVCLVPSL